MQGLEIISDRSPSTVYVSLAIRLLPIYGDSRLHIKEQDAFHLEINVVDFGNSTSLCSRIYARVASCNQS